jgi:hypothetical protein
MRRSIYPEGVEVHQTDLANTETTKIAEILQTSMDGLSCGVQTGLAVTVNGGDATKIDIATGRGYAPNGEIVELLGAQLAQPLADYTLGGINYVVAVYTETYLRPEAHETQPTVFNTQADRASRVVILTAAQYVALASTSTDLTVNAKDRSVILAIVTANGAGVNLTAASIKSPPTYVGIIDVLSGPTPVIPGVILNSVAQGASAGTGYLDFVAGSPATIRYRAPGDSSAGTYTNLTADGTYTLTSVSGKTCSVSVVLSTLPAGNQTSTITLDSLYGPAVPRNSALDLTHRNFLGTGIVTPQNPHGLSIADIGGSADAAVIDHQSAMHTNGIWSGSTAGALAPSVYTFADASQYNLFFAAQMSNADRAWVKGRKITTITPTQIDFRTQAGVGIEQELWGIYVSSAGLLQAYKRIARGLGNSLQNFFTIIGCSDTLLAGNHTIVQTSFAGVFGVGAVYSLAMDGGPAYNIPNVDTTGINTPIRIFGPNFAYWIDVVIPSNVDLQAHVTTTETFIASNLPTVDAYMRVAYVPCTGSHFGYLLANFTGSRAGYNAILINDQRTFGNTSRKDIQLADARFYPQISERWARRYVDDRAMFEHFMPGTGGTPIQSTGILGQGFFPTAGSGTTVAIGSGMAYTISYARGVAGFDGLEDTVGSTFVSMIYSGGNVTLAARPGHLTARLDFIYAAPSTPHETASIQVADNVIDPADGSIHNHIAANLPTVGCNVGVVTGIVTTSSPASYDWTASNRAPAGAIPIAFVLVRASDDAGGTNMLASDIFEYRQILHTPGTPQTGVINGFVSSVDYGTPKQLKITDGSCYVAGQLLRSYTSGGSKPFSTDGASGGFVAIPSHTGNNLTNLSTNGWLYLYAVRRPVATTAANQDAAPAFVVSSLPPIQDNQAPQIAWPDAWISQVGAGVFLGSIHCAGSTNLTPFIRDGSIVKFVTPTYYLGYNGTATDGAAGIVETAEPGLAVRYGINIKDGVQDFSQPGATYIQVDKHATIAGSSKFYNGSGYTSSAPGTLGVITSGMMASLRIAGANSKIVAGSWDGAPRTATSMDLRCLADLRSIDGAGNMSTPGDAPVGFVVSAPYTNNALSTKGMTIIVRSSRTSNSQVPQDQVTDRLVHIHTGDITSNVAFNMPDGLIEFNADNVPMIGSFATGKGVFIIPIGHSDAGAILNPVLDGAASSAFPFGAANTYSYLLNITFVVAMKSYHESIYSHYPALA